MTTDGRHIEDGVEAIDEEQLIKNIQDDYDYSLKTAKPFLDIAVKMKLEHDNAIDPATLPTRSKMSIPHKFAQVEEALANAHELLWPKTNQVRVVPEGPSVTIDQARNVERALYHMAKDRMGCETETLPIERDCLKVGFGYGIVERCNYQTLEPVILDMDDEKGGSVSSREMDISEPTPSLRLRYISPGQVIPYPDGWTTNGYSRSSQVFFWDFETERNFRNLVSEENLEGLDFDVEKLGKEDIDEIVDDAKKGNIDFGGNTFEYIKKLGGIDYTAITNAEDEAPATIPILKVYREGEHIWLANGKRIIYRQAARVQTFQCPLLKMSAVRDAMHWYPYTTSEALMDINYNRNIWMNLVTDIMTWSAKRPGVYSTSAFDDAPEFGPDSWIPTTAPDARMGAAFLQPPPLQNGDIQMGQILDQRASEISGEKDFMQKNYSRGGQHAFNDLLNSSRGRQRIAATVMESGFMKDLFTQILVYMQIQGIGYGGNIIEFDEDDGVEKITNLAVTGDDMKHSFTISVSLDKKYTATEFSVTERLQIYREGLQDETNDKYELARFLFGNDELTHQIKKPRKEVDRIDNENRDVRLESERAAAQGVQAPQGAAGLSPELGGAVAGGAPALGGIGG